MMKCLLLVTLCVLFVEWFPFPLYAWDRLHHLIVALPEPSIQLFRYQIINIDKLTASFSWPFEIIGLQISATLVPLMEQSET